MGYEMYHCAILRIKEQVFTWFVDGSRLLIGSVQHLGCDIRFVLFRSGIVSFIHSALIYTIWLYTRYKKTCIRILRPDEAQTSLHSYTH